MFPTNNTTNNSNVTAAMLEGNLNASRARANGAADGDFSFMDSTPTFSIPTKNSPDFSMLGDTNFLHDNTNAAAAGTSTTTTTETLAADGESKSKNRWAAMQKLLEEANEELEEHVAAHKQNTKAFFHELNKFAQTAADVQNAWDPIEAAEAAEGERLQELKADVEHSVEHVENNVKELGFGGGLDAGQD